MKSKNVSDNGIHSLAPHVTLVPDFVNGKRNFPFKLAPQIGTMPYKSGAFTCTVCRWKQGNNIYPKFASGEKMIPF